MRRNTVVIGLCVIFTAVLMMGCAGMTKKASQANFIQPKVSLEMVEVAHYWGWWYYSNKVKPTTGKAGNHGAPLDLAFIFNIENPNPYPVELESLKFTVAFEEFDLNTVSSTDSQWIPAGKTNQLRVHAMFDGRQSLLSLLVVGGFKLKDKTGSAGPGAALKQLATWWEKVPEYGFPISVKEGAAVFKADSVTEVTQFDAVFP